jgi:hypothetical protein
VVVIRARAPAHAGRVDMSLWQHAVKAVAGEMSASQACSEKRVSVDGNKLMAVA